MGACAAAVVAAVAVAVVVLRPGHASTQETFSGSQHPPETQTTLAQTETANPMPEDSESSTIATTSEASLEAAEYETQETTQPSITEVPTEVPQFEEMLEEDGVAFGNFSLFSGQFVENGRDEPVENVAAILVTNNSERFLDLATLTFEVDGKPATFMVTGLPAGRSAWVLEMQGLTAEKNSVVNFLECIPSFRNSVQSHPEEISVEAQGNMLTLTNESDQKLEGVFLYYKNLHPDGNFLGGITYLVEAGDLEPGASVEVLAGHYDKENSEIVRIGWKNQ